MWDTIETKIPHSWERSTEINGQVSVLTVTQIAKKSKIHNADSYW